MYRGQKHTGFVAPTASPRLSANPNPNPNPNPAPTVSLIATPSVVSSGESSVLTWTSANANSCTGTNFSTGGALNNATGSSTRPLSSTQTYSISCTGAGGTSNSSATVNVSEPSGQSLSATCTDTETKDSSGNITSVTWTANPSNGSGSYTYLWQGQDISGTNPSFTFSNPIQGTYTPILTVSDGSNSFSPSCNPVTIGSIGVDNVDCYPTDPSTGNRLTATNPTSPVGKPVKWVAYDPTSGNFNPLHGTYTWSGDGLASPVSASSVTLVYSTIGTKLMYINGNECTLNPNLKVNTNPGYNEL